ncbi:MAG: polysaccharide deacetylase family protein [Steroidobacteraceae bacterium]|jgi:peptidoglycan/xylan/chitin deacetylase (PgdA/CDA1 family)|nr:polysaccharide deacetylase family protein [Steroidobacteraceae bacterium]
MAGWTWPNGARLALSLVVNVEEGAEFNVRDGDRGPDPVDELGIVLKKPVRNFGNESNYEYGINEGAPRVLRLLAKYQLKATFTAAAVALERAPQVAAGIVEGGHEACAHGHRWAHQMGMDEEKERAFIRAAADSIEKTTGTRPVGWLSRYLHTPDTRRILAEEGFRYHMDDFSRDLPFVDRSVSPAMVVVPYALDSNDMKMWNAPAFMPRDWLGYCKDSFDWLYAEGAQGPRMMSLGVHLRIIGRPGRIGAYEEFLRHAAATRHVWIATRREIAEHYARVAAG